MAVTYTLYNVQICTAMQCSGAHSGARYNICKTGCTETKALNAYMLIIRELKLKDFLIRN